MLGLGAVLANLLGTTGASVLLIRPLLRANQSRRRTVHIVVFFIFLVANCGGLLTPIGDPPLLLGFLKGVPFAWTLRLWPQWLTLTGALLVVFNVWDQWALDREERERPGSHTLKTTSSAPVSVSHCGHNRSVHAKGTPFRKPSSRGGSPMGVSNPPQFATRKMKNTTMCTVRRRLWLARSSGRIKRTEAPVVPRRFASTAPSPSIPVFTSGVPDSDPCT